MRETARTPGAGADGELVDASALKVKGDVAFTPSGIQDHRTPTVRHRLEFALFQALRWVVGRLPEGLVERGGAAVGRLAYALGLRRRVALDNLRAAFPERDEAWGRATALASYLHFGRETAATLRSVGRSPHLLREISESPDLHVLRAAWEEGRGVVLVAGHLGNWEVGASALAAHGFPVDLVVLRQRNPLFNQLLVRTRLQLGVGVIERRRAPTEAMRALRAGRVVCFAADQHAGPGGVAVPFFGRLASTHRGPALLAVRAEAPMVLAAPVRSAAGYPGPIRRIEVDRDGPRAEVVHRLTAAFTRTLEEVIRDHPEQYLWQHRRWRTPEPPVTRAEEPHA